MSGYDRYRKDMISGLYSGYETAILEGLAKEDVVIKVDDEMPRCMNFERYTALTKYVAVELG